MPNVLRRKHRDVVADEDQVKVGTSGDQTVVNVTNDQGDADDSPTAIRILTLLKEQIR